MNILHITDFHFKQTKQDDFQQFKIIEKMIENLKTNNVKVDFVFFTGDLVFAGSDRAVFEKAKILLIDSILEAFNLDLERFFICPGNHDVDRSLVSKAIITQIDAIRSNDELERYVKPNDIDYKSSLQPLSNYNEFVKGLFSESNGVNFFENGCSSHVRNFNGKKIGIFCANTSWRAIGQNDEGNLLIPLRFIREGLVNLRGCDLKVFLHHHPISQIKLFNQYDLEDVIHNNFNISFYGHLHKGSKSITYTNTDGILKLASAATLAESDGSTIGYTLLSLNLETLAVDVQCYKYDRTEEFFYTGNPIKLQIPISVEKEAQNKFRQRLRELYEMELENADDLFLNGKVNKDGKGFKELWTSPVISSKSPEEVKKLSGVPIVNPEEFLSSTNNYLIMGDDKCGKTSLLKKIQLDCFTTYNIYETIPVYINAKKFDKEGETESKILREISRYYSVNRATALGMARLAKVLLLIDNIDLRNENERVWLQELVNCFNHPRVIMCSDQNSSSKYQNVEIGNNLVVNIYFHSLKKRQIRELAEKFYGNSDAKVDVLNRIYNIFNMLAIPFNFWSVSLFMWVFKDTSRDITNDVDLVDLYIESILEREKLIKNKSGFGYDKYKQFLARLSRFLLSKPEDGYSASLEEILHFTQSYLDENLRNNTTAFSVWTYIESKGIVKQLSSTKFTFRLNGVFEYFLAHYLKLDENFRNEVINDDNIYLSFKNELEMYAGTNRGDEIFVEKIFSKTKVIFKNINNLITVDTIDATLQQLSTNDLSLRLDSSQVELMKQSFTQDEVDEFEDEFIQPQELGIDSNSEVRIKQFVPIDENDLVSLEKALYILGRVFKNADDIKNRDLINQVFDYLIDTTICWGYKLFQSLAPEDLEDVEEKHKILILIKLMKQMLPIIVQSRISDMIGANNIQSIVKNKITFLEKEDNKQNQFKKFILLYLLVDIDLIKNFKYIQTSIDSINIPILRYAILTKILYYYNFRISELNGDLQSQTARQLQNMYKEAGNKFNKKLYRDDNVSATFKNIDKKKFFSGRR